MFFVYCTCVYNARLAYFGASEISQSPLLPLFSLAVQRVGGGGGGGGGGGEGGGEGGGGGGGGGG